MIETNTRNEHKDVGDNDNDETIIDSADLPQPDNLFSLHDLSDLTLPILESAVSNVPNISTNNRFSVLEDEALGDGTTTKPVENMATNPNPAGQQHCCMSDCNLPVRKPWHHFCRNCYITHG